MYLKIFNNIKSKNVLDYNDIYYLINQDYDINDIIIVKKHYNINNYEYYISVCPIYAFILDKKKFQ